jgi:hypothetical protein
MPDRPGTPADPLTPLTPLKGKITQISATYTVNTDSGPWRTFHGLAAMHKQASPARVEELIENLTVICEELLAARGRSPLGVPPGMVRVPFASSPPAADAALAAGAPWRELLTAIRDALDCPPPATAADEETFLRLRCARARLALAAAGSVLADRESSDAELTAAAGNLRHGLADYPADDYQHSALSS